MSLLRVLLKSANLIPRMTRNKFASICLITRSPISKNTCSSMATKQKYAGVKPKRVKGTFVFLNLFNNV
jgi:hypothetical protein